MIINKSTPSKEDIRSLNSLNFDKIANLKIDFDFTDIVVKKPWGYEYLLFESQDIAIWILYIEKNQTTSMHCHPKKHTSLICLEGQINCKTLDNEYNFNKFDGIYLGKGVFHQTLNMSNKYAIVMEIESPVDKSDLVRMKDNYGRVQEKYESEKYYIKTKDLTIKNIFKNKVSKKIGNSILEIGILNKKNDLSILINKYKTKDLKILSLLNKYTFINNDKNIKEVGRIIEIQNFNVEEYKINDDFMYLMLFGESL